MESWFTTKEHEKKYKWKKKYIDKDIITIAVSSFFSPSLMLKWYWLLLCQQFVTIATIAQTTYWGLVAHKALMEVFGANLWSWQTVGILLAVLLCVRCMHMSTSPLS